MGNEAAAMAQGAEQSSEIIHYAATEIAPGIVNQYADDVYDMDCDGYCVCIIFHSIPQP